jgi:hypothetical protein
MIAPIKNLKMKMTKILATLTLSFIVLSALSLHAQPLPSTAIQQMQNVQNTMEQQQPLVSLKAGTNAPEVYPGENTDIGPQHILRVMQHRSLFEVRLGEEYLYTDNALLTTKGMTRASEIVSTLEAAYAPTPYKVGDGRFAPAVGFINQWYNYWNNGAGLNLSKVDFVVQTLYARAAYLFQNNWSAYGEFDYNRLLNPSQYNEFYHDFTPKAGVQRLFQLRDNLLFSASFDTAYHFSWQNNAPNDSQDRWENTLGLSLSYQVTPKIVLQPYYRLEYSYYEWSSSHTPGRNDLLNSFGLSAGYYFTPALSLRAFVNYDAKITDDNLTPSYRDYNLGLDLTYTLRF